MSLLGLRRLGVDVARQIYSNAGRRFITTHNSLQEAIGGFINCPRDSEVQGVLPLEALRTYQVAAEIVRHPELFVCGTKHGFSPFTDPSPEGEARTMVMAYSSEEIHDTLLATIPETQSHQRAKLEPRVGISGVDLMLRLDRLSRAKPPVQELRVDSLCPMEFPSPFFQAAMDATRLEMYLQACCGDEERMTLPKAFEGTTDMMKGFIAAYPAFTALVHKDDENALVTTTVDDEEAILAFSNFFTGWQFLYAHNPEAQGQPAAEVNATAALQNTPYALRHVGSGADLWRLYQAHAEDKPAVKLCLDHLRPFGGRARKLGLEQEKDLFLLAPPQS